MKVVSFYNLSNPFEIVDIGVNLPKNQEILKRKKYIKTGNLNIPAINIDDLIKITVDFASCCHIIILYILIYSWQKLMSMSVLLV